MNDSISGWVEAVANVGVLLGLIFLAYEVNQNTVNQRMEAKLALSERFAELDGGVADNGELASILVKADLRGEALDPVEWMRYEAHYNRWMNILMRVQALHEDGVLDGHDWREYVCEARLQYVRSAAFRQFVEGVRRQYLTDSIHRAVATPDPCGDGGPA